MRLKEIELIGFKSFADRTRLKFEAGITAIVGPNGCGKSNIADAFRWVLGEQSAKSLRGGKMADVIFAGSSSRKQLPFAEVTITLTEIGESLPIAYDEIAITRRLHRNGDSDYFLNRQPVRLKDVQSLFWDTGVGKDAYSIFEQGKIEQIIHFTPMERRAIFEEASGILRFLQRKRETLRKLEQADQNVTRLKDITQEVEQQMRVLEQQAEKAKVYKENKACLENLEKTILYRKWEQHQKRKKECLAKESTLQGSLALSQQNLDRFTEQKLQAREELAEKEKCWKERNQELFQTRTAKEMKTRERLSHQERYQEALTNERRWQKEWESLGERRKNLCVQMQSIQEQQKEGQATLIQQEQTVKELRLDVQQLEKSVGEVRTQQQALQQQLMKLLQEEGKLESECKQTAVRLENGQERQLQLNERRQKLVEQKEVNAQQLAEKQQAFEAISQEMSSQKQVLRDLEQTLQNCVEETQKREKEKELSQREYAELRARYTVLVRMREEKEGFSAAAKRLLKEAAAPASPLYQKLKGLYEWITPEQGFEKIVAAALRPYAQTLTVETYADFQAVLAFAQEHKLKDFSLICLETIPPFAESQNLAIDLLSKKAAPNALAVHFLRQIGLAQNIEAAFTIGKTFPELEVWAQDGVHQEGVLLDKRRVLFCAMQGENNAFVRESEIKALEKQLALCEEKRTELEALLAATQKRKTEVAAEKRELEFSFRSLEMKVVEINFALQRHRQEQEREKLEEQRLEQEMQTLRQTEEKFSALIQEWQQKLTLVQGECKEKQAALAELSSLYQKYAEALQKQQKVLRESEITFQKNTEETRKEAHSLHVLEVKDLESGQQQQRLEEEIRKCRELQAQCQQAVAECEQAFLQIEEALSQVTKSHTEIEREIAAQKAANELLDARIQEHKGDLHKCEAKMQQERMTAAQMLSICQTLEQEFQERYGAVLQELIPHDAQERAYENPLEKIEKQARALQRELEAAGDIHMGAIEEWERYKARYGFLHSQLQDLGSSKEELLEIIQQLDKESRKLFKDTFEQIRINFQKNFHLLFNGGEANLELTESADILEAGIEIVAKPPGKQMRSIQLLSGGEKCLTALALLFAIFEVKPAPFCILDEMDAPLDDANIERFVGVLKQFIDRCQFLLITHNKRTMAIADLLYGISMEEKGVSKVLMMEFRETGAACEIQN